MFWEFVFFFKQKTAYEMRISDWSSDVCSSDLDLDQPLVQIIVCSDRLGMAIGTGGANAAGQRLVQEIARRVQEERHRIARMPAASGRRVDDAVRGRGGAVVGQDRHGVL